MIVLLQHVTAPASKKPADQEQQQCQRKNQDVRIHAHDGRDAVLVAQGASVEMDCKGAEPESAEDA